MATQQGLGLFPQRRPWPRSCHSAGVDPYRPPLSHLEKLGIQTKMDGHPARRITKSVLWSVMKKVSLLLVVLSLGTFVFAGTARQDADNRLENSAQVMHEIMNAPDKGIPQEVLEHAKCVAVVPIMLKGGF